MEMHLSWSLFFELQEYQKLVKPFNFIGCKLVELLSCCFTLIN